MRVALYQMQAALGAVEANLAKIEMAASAASAMGATLLVTPEMSIPGYALDAQTARYAEPADGPSVQRLKAIAAEKNIALVAGFAEAADGAVYNSAVLVQTDGTTESIANAISMVIWSGALFALPTHPLPFSRLVA